MARSLAGHDAVLSAFGPTTIRTTTLRREFGHALASAMREGGVRRVQLVSAAFLFRKVGLLGAILKPTLFRFMAPDMAGMEREVMQDDLEWTVLRPPRLTNGPRTGRYRVAECELPASGFAISRADVADFMIHEAETPAHLRQIVGLARALPSRLRGPGRLTGAIGLDRLLGLRMVGCRSIGTRSVTCGTRKYRPVNATALRLIVWGADVPMPAFAIDRDDSLAPQADRRRSVVSRDVSRRARDPCPGPGSTPGGTAGSRVAHHHSALVRRDVVAGYYPASVRQHRSRLIRGCFGRSEPTRLELGAAGRRRADVPP